MPLVGVAQSRAGGAGAEQRAGGAQPASLLPSRRDRDRDRPVTESLHAVSHVLWRC